MSMFFVPSFGVLFEKCQKHCFSSSLFFPPLQHFIFLLQNFYTRQGNIARFHGQMGPSSHEVSYWHTTCQVGNGRGEKINFNYFLVLTGVEDCPLKTTTKEKEAQN